jgi:hypothetical protein
MIKRLSFAEQCIVRIICAIALLFVGLAHQPPVIDSPAIPFSEIANYTLPDGTLPDLCLSAEGDHGKHHGQPGSTGCEACRLSTAMALPAPLDVVGQPVAWQTASVMPPLDAVVPLVRVLPSSSPRGPPSRFSA